jgi:hypothetical protein
MLRRLLVVGGLLVLVCSVIFIINQTAQVVSRPSSCLFGSQSRSVAPRTSNPRIIKPICDGSAQGWPPIPI